MVIDEWAQGVWKSVQKEYLVDQKKRALHLYMEGSFLLLCNTLISNQDSVLS